MGVTRYNVFKGKTVQKDEKIRGTHRWLTLLADRNVSYVVYKNVTSTCMDCGTPWSVFEAKYLTKKAKATQGGVGRVIDMDEIPRKSHVCQSLQLLYCYTQQHTRGPS
jgi:hypothetical protein